MAFDKAFLAVEKDVPLIPFGLRPVLILNFNNKVRTNRLGDKSLFCVIFDKIFLSFDGVNIVNQIGRYRHFAVKSEILKQKSSMLGTI